MDSPVVLCLADPHSLGGTELQVEIIAEALKHHFGHCLVLITGEIEGGKSNLFLKRLKALKIPVVKRASLLKGSKICHFFNPKSTLLAPLMKKMGLAIYYMETGMPSKESPEWDVLPTKMFDYVSSVSLAGLQRLERFYGYQGPSCIIPSLFHLPPRHFRCRKPIEGVFNLVYFGRMTENKGVDLLIEAFHRLLKEIPYARLFLIGSGKRLPLLQKLSRSERIEFTGWLQGEELFSRLVNMDLMCLPSFSEGVPCSILEAMSIGLPVLATHVGGIPEILSEVLIPPHDIEALTQALLQLAKNPLRRMHLSQEGLLQWEKVGKREVILDRLMAAYTSKFQKERQIGRSTHTP